jgi:hypothetical protein
MVSVLPPHIAFEMKNEMIRKTRKAQMKSLLAHEESFNHSETKEKSMSFQKFAGFFKKLSGGNPSQNGQFDLARNSSEKSLMTSKKSVMTLSSRPKPSTFHDLHIKSHSNVR